MIDTTSAAGLCIQARHLTAAGIGFTLADNAFVRIDDWPRAQALADQLSPDRLLAGMLSCYDRIVVTGTLPTVCYADGMNAFSLRQRCTHLRLACRAGE